LDEVEEIVDTLASALYATRVDKIGISNSIGYSKVLNELNKKYKNDQWVKLAEIEGDKADLMMRDLAILKKQIIYAKNLNSVNSGRKLVQQAKVGYNRQYIFYNKIKNFVDIVRRELPEWNISSITEALKEIDVLEKYNDKKNSNRRFGLTSEEKLKIE
jgi:hypothetical protein